MSAVYEWLQSRAELNDYPRILEAWGATSVLRRVRGLDEAAVPSLSLVDAHVAAAGSSRGRVAQISSDRDSVQSAFYLISGSPAARDVTYALLGDISQRLPGFRSFLVDGAPVDDVRCAECTQD